MTVTRRTLLRQAAGSAAALVLAGETSPFAAEPPPVRLAISAGDIDRNQTIATANLGEAWAGKTVVLAGDAGNTLLAGVRPDGRAVMVIPQLKAGQTRTYVLANALPVDADHAMVSATRRGDAIEARVNGKPVLTYRGGKTPLPPGFEPEYARGGYLHPLVTPGGVTVTDDYPPAHKHHHGVWSPWTATRFEGRKPDFWNMGQKSGTVEAVEVGKTWGGPVAAGFTATHRFVDLSAKPGPKVALNETWQVDVYAVHALVKGPPRYHLFDWQSTQTCAADSPLVLPQYHYGGLGVRGHRSWDGATNSAFLTSEGKTRADGNETRARWMCNAGKVEGKPAYVAVLCPPDNFRAPQPVRLHPSEPFMCFAPQQLGEFAIEPGKPYVARYRFVVGDGEPDRAELDRLWADYAAPAGVEVR